MNTTTIAATVSSTAGRRHPRSNRVSVAEPASVLEATEALLPPVRGSMAPTLEIDPVYEMASIEASVKAHSARLKEKFAARPSNRGWGAAMPTRREVYPEINFRSSELEISEVLPALKVVDSGQWLLAFTHAVSEEIDGILTLTEISGERIFVEARGEFVPLAEISSLDARHFGLDCCSTDARILALRVICKGIFEDFELGKKDQDKFSMNSSLGRVTITGLYSRSAFALSAAIQVLEAADSAGIGGGAWAMATMHSTCSCRTNLEMPVVNLDSGEGYIIFEGQLFPLGSN